MALFRRKKDVEAADPVEERPQGLPGAPADDEHGRRPFEEYRRYLCSLVEPLHPFGLGISDAFGLSLCENVPAPDDVPRETTAAIDGFALDCSATRLAGRPDAVAVQVDRRPPTPVAHGTAVEVMAGARMPAGTDCVVSHDHLDPDGVLQILEPVRQWSGCRLAGSDFSADETLLVEGTTIHAGSVALLAEAGVDKVLARPRPRVVVLGTGGGSGARALDTTARVVAAAAHVAGAHVWRVEVDPTDTDDLVETITDQLIRADLLLATSDRMVPGDRDPVAEVLPRLGATDFCQVAMEPGSVHGFGLVGPERTPVLVMPSGPGAALASFHAFALPLLRTLSGVDGEDDEVLVETAVPLHPDEGVNTFLPVQWRTVSGRRVITPAGLGDLSHVPDLADADALAVLRPGRAEIPVGATVTCWPLRRR